MSQSTWYNTLNSLHAAVHDSYAAKSARQCNKREVQDVMRDIDAFCQRKRQQLFEGTYHVGSYRHFPLRDKKKQRDISVLPYEDRCVQNALKQAIEPLLLRMMTDDMLGGLPHCGVLSKDKRHQVVQQMREAMNDRSMQYYLQGDIRKFYDHVDNIISMQLIEQQLEATGVIDVTLQPQEWSTYVTALTGGEAYAGGVLGWFFDFPDSSNYLEPFVFNGGLGTMVTSPEGEPINDQAAQLVDLLNEASVELDEDARAGLYEEIQELYADLVVTLPILFEVEHVVPRDGVSGSDQFASPETLHIGPNPEFYYSVLSEN